MNERTRRRARGDARVSPGCRTTSDASAAEAHGAGRRVLSNAALNQLTSSSRRLSRGGGGARYGGDAGRRVDPHGRRVERLEERRRRRRVRGPGVPVLRHARRRSKLALLHGGRRPSARRSSRTRTGRTRASRSTSTCRRAAGAAPARRPCTGASTRARPSRSRTIASCSTSRMHAAHGRVVDPRRRRDVRAASTAQKRADIVRLLEQATFGPNDAPGRARRGGRRCGVPRRAVRGVRVARFERQVRAGGGGGHLTVRPTPIRPARATTTRCSRCRPTSSAMRSRQRPAAPARGVRAVADLRHVGRRHPVAYAMAALPADLPRRRVRQLRRRCSSR